MRGTHSRIKRAQRQRSRKPLPELYSGKIATVDAENRKMKYKTWRENAVRCENYIFERLKQLFPSAAVSYSETRAPYFEIEIASQENKESGTKLLSLLNIDCRDNTWRDPVDRITLMHSRVNYVTSRDINNIFIVDCWLKNNVWRAVRVGQNMNLEVCFEYATAGSHLRAMYYWAPASDWIELDALWKILQKQHNCTKENRRKIKITRIYPIDSRSLR
jgi:hypothetical protein